MASMFKIGEKVKVRPDLALGYKHNYFGINTEMLKLAGHIVTIKQCASTLHIDEYKQGIIDGYWYAIEEDSFGWTADCFVDIEEINPAELLDLL